ncbi:MAG: phosphoethanolamine--lipid A transferase [Gammaproteobacteria bacterium]|nr:phosphoethanolamine--lipid A transferase [Gammaproteobacteria bacterium]
MALEYKISSNKLILISSIFLVLTGNIAFFNNVQEFYPVNSGNNFFLFSLIITFSCINVLIFSLFCFPKTVKPVLITVLLISSLAAYFMDTYNVIIDDSMIDNIVKTDLNETLDLLSFKQVLYLIFLGVLPSFIVYKAKIIQDSLKRAVIANILFFTGALVIALSLILSLSDFYASFFREHKSLRFYSNPSYYIYSSINYVHGKFKSSSSEFKQIGLDAKNSLNDKHRELVIFVVGETVRADHLSLNGYLKKTTPILEKEKVVSFNNVWSCGTSTAHSLPCMFSIYGRSDFTKSKASSTENVLDVLKRAGTNVIWLDNNSSSKGVADRIENYDYKSPKNNPICDLECRDEGMLVNLQKYIDEHPTGDIFIVLHQMGNHGPAYYKRYPKEFEKFTPLCRTNQLEQCTQEEISNAYDNAILYTDYFLSKTIELLKNNDPQFETALFYVSDHGESLGENNLYLHGLPYMIAPKEQIHVPMILWFGEKFQVNFVKLKEQAHKKLSHDNLFHTILGMMEIETEVYDKELDFIKDIDYRNTAH